jgi:hypothetical protein
MQNNDPKSENAAMKERAAKDKGDHGRLHDTVPHRNAEAHAGHGGEVNKESERKNAEPSSHKGK